MGGFPPKRQRVRNPRALSLNAGQFLGPPLQFFPPRGGHSTCPPGKLLAATVTVHSASFIKSASSHPTAPKLLLLHSNPPQPVCRTHHPHSLSTGGPLFTGKLYLSHPRTSTGRPFNPTLLRPFAATLCPSH